MALVHQAVADTSSTAVHSTRPDRSFRVETSVPESMTDKNHQELTTTEAFARFRYAALKRADALLDAATAKPDSEAPAVTELSALVMTSIEELKVAEEEL